MRCDQFYFDDFLVGRKAELLICFRPVLESFFFVWSARIRAEESFFVIVAGKSGTSRQGITSSTVRRLYIS